MVTRRSQYRLARRRERLHLVEGLLVAILDIDEVIQVIRTSDDSEAARTRLMEVFDLSQVQAEYILELRLRRLTRFSRIELETERDELHREIEELEAILADPARIRLRGLRRARGDRGEVRHPAAHAAHRGARRPSRRRRSRSARAAAPDLEIADAPCRIFLSTTGRIIRVDLPEDGSRAAGSEATQQARRHPVGRWMRRAAPKSVRSPRSADSFGSPPSTCRPCRRTPIQLAAGARIADYLALANKKERVLGLVSLTSEHPIALGTAQGVVKRVAPGLPAKPDFEIIALKPGDEVVGVAQGPESDDLVFVTTRCAAAALSRRPPFARRVFPPAAWRA